jgi:hypothetical protein
MSCCGGHRAAQRASYQNQLSSSPQRASFLPGTGANGRGRLPVKHVTFEFSGATPIVVTGPATGTPYRFSARGARLTVHASDAPSLISVPGLKPVL